MNLTVTPREDHRTPVRRIDAVIGGPVWWAVHLGGTYWLIPRVCAWQVDWPLHLLTVLMLALTARAWLSGVQVLRAARLTDPDVDTTARRDIFIGWTGIMLAILFGVVILYEGVPAIFLDACSMTPAL